MHSGEVPPKAADSVQSARRPTGSGGAEAAAASSPEDSSNESPFHRFAVLRKESTRPHRAPSASSTARKPPSAFPCFLDTNRLEKRKIFMNIVQVLNHPVGAVSEKVSKESLLVHAQHALGIDDASKAKWAAEVQEVHAAPAARDVSLQVEVELIGASNVAAKDSSGTSDPYCTLELVPAGKPSTLRHHIPKGPLADNVRQSKICFATLNPVWKEVFVFDLPPQGDMEVHVDMWDHDEGQEGSGQSTLKNLRKKLSALRPGHEKDDYLGYVIIPLSTIPASGATKDFSLLPRSSRSHVSGTVSLRIKIRSALPPSTTTTTTTTEVGAATAESREVAVPACASWAILSSYQGLMEVAVRADTTKAVAEAPNRLWDGKLSESSTGLLYQYAIQNGVSSFQQDLIKWIVLCKFFLSCGMQAGALLRVLEELLKCVHALCDEMGGEEQAALLSSIDDMMGCAKRTVSTLHASVDCNDDGAAQLEALVKIAVRLSSLDLWRQTQAGAFTLREVLGGALADGIRSEYKAAKADLVDGGGGEMRSMVRVISAAMFDIDNLSAYFHTAFALVELDILEEAARAYDRLIINDCKLLIADACKPGTSDISPTVFELYLALAQMAARLLSACSPAVAKELAIPAFYDQYEPVVLLWLDQGKANGRVWVHKAVEVDKLEPVTATSFISSSAVDVTRLVCEMWEFWDHLAWPPQQRSSRQFLDLLADVVLVALQEYVARLMDDVAAKTAGCLFEDKAHKYCLIVNNISCCTERMEELVIPPLRAAMQSSLRANSLRIDVSNTAMAGALVNCTASLRGAQKTATVMLARLATSEIRERMLTAIYGPLHEPHGHGAAAHTGADGKGGDSGGDAEGKEKKTPADVVQDYIASSLDLLVDLCQPVVFDALLQAVWTEVVSALRLVLLPVDCSERKYAALTPAQQTETRRMVDGLASFFRADGKGLPREKVETPEFTRVRELLTHACARNTEDLIAQYYLETARSPTTQEKSRGAIKVRMHIEQRDRGPILCVTVMECHITPVKEHSGSINAVVKIKTVPGHSDKKYKTAVKKSLDPVFKETFEIPLPASYEQVVVMLVVLDFNFPFSYDFLGEASVALVSVGNVASDEVMTLPLHSDCPHGQALEMYRLIELRRKQDKTAATFVKGIKGAGSTEADSGSAHISPAASPMAPRRGSKESKA